MQSTRDSCASDIAANTTHPYSHDTLQLPTNTEVCRPRESTPAGRQLGVEPRSGVGVNIHRQVWFGISYHTRTNAIGANAPPGRPHPHHHISRECNRIHSGRGWTLSAPIISPCRVSVLPIAESLPRPMAHHIVTPDILTAIACRHPTSHVVVVIQQQSLKFIIHHSHPRSSGTPTPSSRSLRHPTSRSVASSSHLGTPEQSSNPAVQILHWPTPHYCGPRRSPAVAPRHTRQAIASPPPTSAEHCHQSVGSYNRPTPHHRGPRCRTAMNHRGDNPLGEWPRSRPRDYPPCHQTRAGWHSRTRTRTLTSRPSERTAGCPMSCRQHHPSVSINTRAILVVCR